MTLAVATAPPAHAVDEFQGNTFRDFYVTTNDFVRLQSFMNIDRTNHVLRGYSRAFRNGDPNFIHYLESTATIFRNGVIVLYGDPAGSTSGASSATTSLYVCPSTTYGYRNRNITRVYPISFPYYDEFELYTTLVNSNCR